MTAGAEVTAPQACPALRYAAVTSALVLALCTVLGTVAGTTLAAAQASAAAATGRAFGTVTAAGVGSVTVSWTPDGGAARVDDVALAGPVPPVGTRTEIAYDPAAPGSPLVPGAALLAGADRALGALVLVGTVAALLVSVDAWQLGTRRRAARRPARAVPVRRVRVRAGMTSRSWLETDTAPRRWIPVHFDPVLVTLPSPATVRLHGDPRRTRLVAAEIGGRILHAAGPVRAVEPRGERTDNATGPDAAAHERAATLGGLSRRLRADLPLLVPAPLVGLLWTYVDRGGFCTWLAATLLAGALGLWFEIGRAHV